MTRLLRPPPSASQLLALARRSFDAAREAMASLDATAQAALVCEAPHAQRADLLELVERPEEVVPLLPDAELCFTARAIGLADAGPLLQHASMGQIRAAVDLDAWRGLAPDRAGLAEWLEALAEASDEKLLEALRGLDRELVVLWLRDAADVRLKLSDEWDPPDGAMTLEGQYFLLSRRGDEHLELVMRALCIVFQADPPLYFQLLQGAIHESDAECEEYALRWRTGRLADLGFPDREEALHAYAYLRPAERARLGAGDPDVPDPGAPDLPSPSALLPSGLDARHALFRAAAGLTPAERDTFLRRFLRLVNQVAVAEGLALGDPDAVPTALERAAATASAGLAHLAQASGLEPREVLRRATLLRLHRIGASLAADARRAPSGVPHRRK